MKRWKLWLGGLAVATLLPLAATADNWPAWRGDGSGASDETDLVATWSAEENLRWKTEVPGNGHSSPVVWDDMIFLTTTENSVELEVFRGLSSMALWILGLIAVAWCAETFFGHPWDPYGRFLGRVPSQSWHRRLVLFLTYGAMAGLCLMVWRMAFRAFPAKLYDLGLVSDSRSIEVSGQSRIVWLAISLSCALAVYGVRWWLDRRQSKTAPSRPSDSTHSPLAWIVGLGLAVLGFTVVASFVGINLLRAIAVGQEHVPSATGHWIRNALICALGWLAAVVATHPRSWWRLLAAGVAAPALYVLYRGPADAPIEWWSQSPKSTLVLAEVVGLIVALVVQGLWLRRGRTADTASSPTTPAGWGAALGPLVLMLLAAVHTGSLAFAAPSNVLLHQVLAFDRDTGKLLWRTTCATRGRAGIHTVNTYATPTPVTDGRRVYANFGEAGTFAVDLDGTLAWEYTGPVPPMQWGASSSPVLWGDTLIVTHDTDTRAFTLAFDTDSGALRWQNQRRPEDSEGLDSFATPIFVDTVAGTQLVHRGNEAAYGYDPETGIELWSRKLPGKETVASPVQWNELVILSYGGNIPIQTVALRLDGAAANEPTEIWEARKMLPGMSSPVVYGDHLYAITDGGIATCRDTATGDLVWRKRLDGRYYASVTAADGKVFFSSLEGVTTVIAAGPEGEVLATNTLDDEEHWASMAISQGDLYLRGLRHLYRIGPPTAGGLAE